MILIAIKQRLPVVSIGSDTWDELGSLVTTDTSICDMIAVLVCRLS